MAPVLLLQLRSIITSHLISIFCKKFEENESLLKKSIDTGICTVLIGLQKTMDNDTAYDRLIDSIINTDFYKTTEFENGKITSINYSFEQEGQVPLNIIFSNKKGRISEMISNEIGVKSETASAILNFSVMLTLSHFAKEKQLESIICDDLKSQKKVILNKVPEGIRVILGYSNFEYEDASTDATISIRSKHKTHFLAKIFKR